MTSSHGLRYREEQQTVSLSRRFFFFCQSVLSIGVIIIKYAIFRLKFRVNLPPGLSRLESMSNFVSK